VLGWLSPQCLNHGHNFKPVSGVEGLRKMSFLRLQENSEALGTCCCIKHIV
jgi:hypothetical protein